MAFSVSLPRDDLEWGSASLAAMFADRRRLADRRHWRFLVEVVRFLRRARRDLGGALVARASLDDYLEARRVHADVRERFVVPLAAALWSLAPERCGAFPAETYLRFLDQHGMLRAARPLPWRTIAAAAASTSPRWSRGCARGAASSCGSRRRSPPCIATGAARPSSPAAARSASIASMIATHADAALGCSPRRASASAPCSARFATAATAPCCTAIAPSLPRARALHAAWNYVADPDSARVAVTYSMTRLQGLPDAPYLVTLNPRREPAGGALHEVWLDHPQLDRAALAAQPELPRASAPRSARTTRARTPASAFTRTACAAGSPPPRARSPTRSRPGERSERSQSGSPSASRGDRSGAARRGRP